MPSPITPAPSRHLPSALNSLHVHDWTDDHVAEWLDHLGLGLHSANFRDNSITGDVLVLLDDDALKDVGVTSIGQRLALLGAIFRLKDSFKLPIEPGDYIPSSESLVYGGAEPLSTSSMTTLLRERDDRIRGLEQEVTRLGEYVLRFQHDFATMSKVLSVSNANADMPLITPFLSRRPSHDGIPLTPSMAYSLDGLPSPSQYGSHPYSTRAMQSPTTSSASGHTVQGSSGHNDSFNGPMSAAAFVQTVTTPGVSTVNGPETYAYPYIDKPGTTTPAGYVPGPGPGLGRNSGPFAAQQDEASGNATTPTGRAQGSFASQQNRTPTANTTSFGTLSGDGLSPRIAGDIVSPSILTPSGTPTTAAPDSRNGESSAAGSQSADKDSKGTSTNNAAVRDRGSSTSSASSGGPSNSSSNPYKSFRVTLDDPCHKVLPAALKKYKIVDDWRLYALFICYGNTERCLSYDEKPLLLFQKLKEAKMNPVFMLRHIRDVKSPIAIASAKAEARKSKIERAGATPSANGSAGDIAAADGKSDSNAQAAARDKGRVAEIAARFSGGSPKIGGDKSVNGGKDANGVGTSSQSAKANSTHGGPSTAAISADGSTSVDLSTPPVIVGPAAQLAPPSLTSPSSGTQTSLSTAAVVAASTAKAPSTSSTGASPGTPGAATTTTSGTYLSPTTFAIAIYPYLSERDDEFDVGVGDTFVVLSKAKGWWIVQRDQGARGEGDVDIGEKGREIRSGWVPAGCLLETKVPLASLHNAGTAAGETADKTEGDKAMDGVSAVEISLRPIPPSIISSTSTPGIMLMDYKAEPDRLDLHKEDRLRVFKRYNHWSYCVQEGGSHSRGWVPSWYIGKLSSSRSATGLSSARARAASTSKANGSGSTGGTSSGIAGSAGQTSIENSSVMSPLSAAPPTSTAALASPTVPNVSINGPTPAASSPTTPSTPLLPLPSTASATPKIQSPRATNQALHSPRTTASALHSPRAASQGLASPRSATFGTSPPNSNGSGVGPGSRPGSKPNTPSLSESPLPPVPGEMEDTGPKTGGVAAASLGGGGDGEDDKKEGDEGKTTED